MDNAILWPMDSSTSLKRHRNYRNICIASVLVAFTIGLTVGVLIPIIYFCSSDVEALESKELLLLLKNTSTRTNEKLIGSVFLNNSHSVILNNSLGYPGRNLSAYPQVSFVETDDLIEDGIFWGKKVEEVLPKGFGDEDNSEWSKHVDKSSGVRLERRCGRMQNRLLTFQDGTRGCVRYRQNLDQIQGELFSFYLAQLLQLPNLAPSTVSLIDLKGVTWQNLPQEISSAQWASNRPVVITKYISNLDGANIPVTFRPPETHLSRRELLKFNSSSIKDYAELAQWSDLVIFDYLTANLDRVVNNLYNKQWNINIMEAPAHNLAKRQDDNLLVFLDNESGLLHGYRLLQKYEPYHALLLDNLCVFRRKTVVALERLRRNQNVGVLLSELFEKNTHAKIRDVLPPLPQKSVKILNERLERVHSQINRCRREYNNYSNSNNNKV